MPREPIPVYDICSISQEKDANEEFLADRLSLYLDKYYAKLHFPHRHSFYHLVMFTKGKGSHSIDFTNFDVQPYQVYFMTPGQVHSWHFEGKADGYIINFSESFFKPFLLNPQYIERFPFFSGISEEGVCPLPATVHKEAATLFESLLHNASLEWRQAADLVRVLLLQLFMLVDEAAAAQSNKGIPQQKLVLLRGFRRLIDTHYRTMRLPKEYADLLYVTPNHLNALCQDLLGKTAGEIIRDRVLLEAKRLLTNASLTVTEVAYNLNFQDNSYFNRFFKKYTGTTPDEFRKQFSH
ncbi:AraC family transcriptional regulator [Paraflavitalea sp. CAU 1676]|uniref:helix-turn-helix domain-containing protein n=1 Tax=Paraflavitalea sp. CAU 1676 TaxID=3032598 RepID=UPI0023D9CC51|nr:AraC family transcriptional regulator [Paraflavitalea sp. CAU 1676]MDF2187878.1 AraC family transcriptional regulator [Paraflavitalea sp. CAU 1676]